MSSSSSSRRDGLPTVVLLVGTQAALREEALMELRQAALAGGLREFNEDHFDFAEGASAARVLDSARTLPMLAPRRLVIVRGLGDRRATSFCEEGLLDYLSAPAPSALLVLEADSVDRRRAWVRRVAEVGEVRDCEAPRRRADVLAWIEARIRARGKRAGAGAASALHDLVGADLDALASEIEKAALFAGEREVIEPDDVAAVTASLRPRALFELTDAIGARRRGDALGTLAQLLEQGQEPLALLGAIAGHFRRLLRARECRPFEAEQVQRRLGVHPFAARKLVEQARRFDRRRLERCLEAVRRTDEVLKGALPLPPRLAIERLVLAVCS